MPNSNEQEGAAIRIGERPASERRETRWGLMLVVFMRIVAALWMFQGLMQWALVLAPGKPVFDTLSPGAAGLVAFFAVIDLVACVGLWLAAPWGGVLWLLAASAQFIVAWLMPGFFAGGRAVMGVDVALVMLYFFITFKAGQTAGGPAMASRIFRN